MSESQNIDYSELSQDELVRLLKEAKREKEEAKREKEEVNRRNEEVNRRNEEVNRRNEILQSLSDGTYYSHITDVWKAEPESFVDANEEEFIRNVVPSLKTKNGAVYQITFDQAIKEGTMVKDDSKSARTSHGKQKDKDRIWPCDIFGNYLPANVKEAAAPKATVNAPSGNTKSDDNCRQDRAYNHRRRGSFQAPDFEKQILRHDEEEEDSSETQSLENVVHGEIAHLVPASPLRASLYFDVARWAFGLNKKIAPEVVQKLIHGCGEPSQKKEGEVGDRIPHTGLKHFITNKIRLRGQGKYFDTTPNVLIVPVMTLQEVKEWNGDSYETIVMIDVLPTQVKQYRPIAEAIGMTLQGTIALDWEVEKARKLLGAAVKMLAKSLRETLMHPPAFLTGKHIDFLKNLGGQTMAFDTSPQVKVPVCHRQIDRKQRVRKVQFVAHDGNEVGHPGPDPMLLLAKGVECWSKFHGETLLAGSDEVDDEMSELSLLAMEEYLDGREERFRNAPMPIKTVVIR